MYTVNLTDKLAKLPAMPRGTSKMTAEQISEHVWKNYALVEKVNPDGRFMGHVGANPTTRFMQKLSDAIFDPTFWKNPTKVQEAGRYTEWVKAAIIHYHAAKPMDTLGGDIISLGYAAW